MKVAQTVQESIVWINGEYFPESEAKISVFDHVVLYGDGVFDTCCAWGGKVFKLNEHIDRLYESAYAVMIDVPVTKEKLIEIVLETVRRNKLSEAYIKILLTRGVGKLPLLSPANCTPSLIVFAKPYMRLSAEGDDIQGIRVKCSSMRRIPSECLDPRIKAINYMNHVLMRMEANLAGVDDAIELDIEGYVAEAPGYNVFAVKNGVFLTPGDNILHGVTRATIIEIAHEMGIEVQETRITPFDLYTADEVFFSSTAGGIYPVTEVDGRRVKDGKAGPLTQKMLNGYLDLLESGIKSTPIYD